MKRFFITVIAITASFSFPYLFLNKIEAYTHEQCMSDCTLQGGINCINQCQGFESDGTTACGLLGCGNLGLDPSRFDNINVLGVITLISSLIFVGIIALGIFFVIKGAFKIINSEGDPSKIEQGTRIFRGIFIGLIMIFVGILGLVLMLALFNAGGVTNIDVELPPTT